MSERFAELMAKGKVGRLSAAEKEELARLLNAPLFDRLTNPSTSFVSKQSFTADDIAARLRRIDWFGRCGEPVSLHLSMPIEQAPAWSAAVATCTDGIWENVELDARNQLTIWLHHHDHQNYQRWNELVDEFKETVLNPLSEKHWEPYRQKHGLDNVVVSSIKWDILGSLMENAYLLSGHQCFFFLELLLVYEAGHFPCGWVGDWPRGKLVIY
jgi:hypothetical protein